jgi:hypothetical protein
MKLPKLFLKRRLTFFALLIQSVFALYGQIQEDTTSIIDKILVKPDSLVQNPLPSKPARKWSQWPPKSSDSLILLNKNGRFSRELNSLLLRLYNNPDVSRKVPVTNSNLIPYDGKYIRNIEIRKVNIFAESALDTGYIPSSWLQRAATSVHSGTRRKIIARNLLMQPGDPLDVFLAAENERLIRDMPYIMDARFLVRPVPGVTDSVDLILLTKDVWPVGFNAEFTRADAGNAGIWYNNIFGFGHQFLTSVSWDGKHNPFLGYRLLYEMPNISGSFVSSEFEYIHRWNTNTSRIMIARDFKTIGLKYAGAAEVIDADLIRDIVMPDSTLPDVNSKYTSYDFWIGRMFSLKKSHPAGISSGLFLTGRSFSKHIKEGPETAEELFYAFQDKTQVFISTGYTHQGFRKDNLIYTFDRTEDVPFGYMFELTSGVEWGQYKNRPYVAAGASFGKYFKNNGYLFGLAEYGTFIYGSSLEQGTFRVQLKAFTRLHSLERLQYRNFASLTYINGINRYKEEYTTMENLGGIHGLAGPSLRGNEKLVLNLESVVFTPYRFLGFRFAFFGSADLGLIKTENKQFLESTVYSGLSLGARIRNDQLIFDTFEIKFSLYPGLPADSRPTYFEIGTVPRLRLSRLFPDKPDVVEYSR